MAEVKYKKGLSENLPKVSVADGQILVTTDAGNMYIDVSDNDRKLIGAGEKTIANGEIFNDYENNKAIDKSIAMGMDNVAGTKAFTVITVLENGFILSNITNLKDSYKYSIKNGSNFEFNIGVITAINTNTKEITVDKMPTIELTGTIYLFTLDDTTAGDTLLNAWEDSTVYPDSTAHLATSVEGRHNIAISTGAHAEGYQNKALGYFTHVEGRGVMATSTQAHAEGRDTLASGNASHAEGNTTIAAGDHGSHAEGWETQALSEAAHAEGKLTEAKFIAHAEGLETKAYGNHSHTEGAYTSTAQG